MPAFCEVTATIRPAPDSNIGVVYRLPENWNGKMLGIGGSGFAGNVTLAAATPGLVKGYAVIETDTGHPSASPFDGSFMIASPGKVNRATLADFGFRAVHLMTTVGKAVVAHYYGRAAVKAYFEGCSTGGRQGFDEVQRYPDDYDGVISGAPIYDLLSQTSALFRLQFFQKDPSSKLTPAKVSMINEAVVKACDLNDGVKDGIIADPSTCTWDPAALACKAEGDASTCLTPREVAAVRRSYAGIKTPDGRVAAYPLPRGGELEWTSTSIGGTPGNPIGTNFTLGVVYLHGRPLRRSEPGLGCDHARASVANDRTERYRADGASDESRRLRVSQTRRQMDHVAWPLRSRAESARNPRVLSRRSWPHRRKNWA